MLQHVHAIYDSQDQLLLQQRWERQVMRLRSHDGQIDLQPGSGALPGDSIATDLFRGPFENMVDQWQAAVALRDDAGFLT
eukprot:5473487-Lingulodinium_polyedra.AAC.1